MSQHFEDAVERMLHEVAKVDRSLLEEARGTIAALPNRRRSVARRMPRRVGFALAGAAIVVGVVAVSVLGPLQSRPIGTNSSSPTMATPPASPGASASAVPLPSAIRTGPAYNETLPVLLTGRYVAFAGWSPDSSRYAIASDGTRSPTIHLFDRSGAEVGSVAHEGLFEFAWLDANRFVVIASEASVNSAGPLAYLGRIGSTELTSVGQYDSLVGGRSGSVALARTGNGDPSVSTKHQYVVVAADGSVSKPRDGDPVAWSRDGSMLAVYHATALAPEPSGVEPPTLGSLEIVRPTGERVASTQKPSFANPGALAFSPDGARVAFTHATDCGNGDPNRARDDASAVRPSDMGKQRRAAVRLHLDRLREDTCRDHVLVGGDRAGDDIRTWGCRRRVGTGHGGHRVRHGARLHVDDHYRRVHADRHLLAWLYDGIRHLDPRLSLVAGRQLADHYRRRLEQRHSDGRGPVPALGVGPTDRVTGCKARPLDRRRSHHPR